MGMRRTDKDVHIHIRPLLAVVAAAVCALSLSAVSSASAASPITGLWALDEGSGQAARDISGYGNHGTLGSSARADAADPSWIALPGSRYFRRSALRFGGDDYVTVADSTTLEPANVSIGAVVRATSPGAFRYVVSKGAIQCRTASYGLYTGRDGGLVFYVSNGVEYSISPDAGTDIWDGRWHLVLGTFDGSVVRLSVDGRQIGEGTPTNMTLAYGFPDNDRFYIGDYRGTCATPLGFVGDIDAVAVGNRAFTWSLNS